MESGLLGQRQRTRFADFGFMPAIVYEKSVRVARAPSPAAFDLSSESRGRARPRPDNSTAQTKEACTAMTKRVLLL